MSKVLSTTIRSIRLSAGGFGLLIVGVYFLNRERQAALSQDRSETQAVREFIDWVKAQPERKRLYGRYYDP